ncbi:MAG: apolipoprotein N-acyltransferase [Gammaproteobacteria bacterium]|nr:apolipoprotein N-acyltransferase [Gammaproteobacteria bacterium]TVQ49283.1 MAG: apolipoprotein N-acyltransferase [Gammaproteobacteria bacterium]
MASVAPALLRRNPAWLALALGAAMPLAFAPFGLWWLSPLLLAALFLLWDDIAPREAARLGFAFGFGHFLAGTYWIYISIHVFGEAPLLLAVVLMLLVVLIMAGYFALLGWFSARVAPAAGPVRWLLVLPAAWVLVEWLRGWLFTGFAWLALGYAQADSWLAGFAPVLGVYGASFAVTLSAGALCCLVAGRRLPPRLVGAAVLLLTWGLAAVLVRVGWTEPQATGLDVALVQGNVSQDLKWAPEQFAATLELYEALTIEALDHDLVVWPEAAIPALVHEVAGYLEHIRLLADEAGSAVMLGILRYDFRDRRYENTLLALGETPQFYVKRHLVPFGEYFPVPAWLRNWLRLLSLPYTDISAGSEGQPPLRLAGQVFGPSICYEALFGASQLVFQPEATLLVNVSNDAWFGDSIAPHQHLQIARLRSLETGRWMLRATNTGISALIDPAGQVVQRSPQFETYVLSGRVVGHEGKTPYMVLGNRAIMLLAGVLLLAGGLVARRG